MSHDVRLPRIPGKDQSAGPSELSLKARVTERPTLAIPGSQQRSVQARWWYPENWLLPILVPCMFPIAWMLLHGERIAIAQDSQNRPRAAEQRSQVTLQDPAIRESSGLARSIRKPGYLWTHNDSGDSARLFLIDPSGSTCAEVSLDGVVPIDWEDMASFESKGVPYLVIGDTGDNARRRKSVQILILPEPELDLGDAKVLAHVKRSTLAQTEIPFDKSFAMDCECLAVDAESREIFLLEKSLFGGTLFSIPMHLGPGEHRESLRMIHKLSIPLATSMDISADGAHLAICNYTSVFLLDRHTDSHGVPVEDWQACCTRPPLEWTHPPMRQSEGICFGSRFDEVWVSSEGESAPLVQLHLPGAFQP